MVKGTRIETKIKEWSFALWQMMIGRCETAAATLIKVAVNIVFEEIPRSVVVKT